MVYARFSWQRLRVKFSCVQLARIGAHWWQDEDATHLMCVSVIVPKSLPHGDKIRQENECLTYSMSPLNRESVKPKWAAGIGPAYTNRNIGWALLEHEWVDTVIPTDVPMPGRSRSTWYHTDATTGSTIPATTPP